MDTPPSRQTRHLLDIFTGITVAVLVVLCVLLVQQYRRIQQLDNIVHQQSSWRSLHGSIPLATTAASSTQAWMTFDYINHVFALPPQYIQTTLTITDKRYPRLTIAKYATGAKIPSAAALLKVQEAIRAYSPAK